MIGSYPMKQAFDPNTVRVTLLHGIKAGHWTLNDLDQPSSGWSYCFAQSKRIPALLHSPFRNLARDPHTTESVQLVNPRDFDVAAATAVAARPLELDILPTQWPPVPGIGNGGDLSDDEECHRPRADHGPQAHLGTTGQGSSLSPGEFLEEADPDTDW